MVDVEFEMRDFEKRLNPVFIFDSSTAMPGRDALDTTDKILDSMEALNSQLDSPATHQADLTKYRTNVQTLRQALQDFWSKSVSNRGTVLETEDLDNLKVLESQVWGNF